ncbi:MAG: glycosyl transferase family 51 [Myxococcales bacterium]|nr:glycosyl transferase family 51 [Myxococcales bacterium]
MSRERRILAATTVLALGVPIGAHALVGGRTDDLAAHLGSAGGVSARIGGVDADLTGTIKLLAVELVEPADSHVVFAADAIEASVALQSMLEGQLGADEIRVAGPRVSLAVDGNGDSDLARLVRRLAHSGSTRPTGSTRVRRIVVSSGTLTAHVAGVGEVSADDVELVPDAGGVRVITGRVRITGGVGKLHGEIELARSAAELALPHVKFGRVLAVAGTGTVTIASRTITLRDVAIGRLEAGGSLELRAAIDDGGVPRAVSAELSAPNGSDLGLTLRGDRVPLAAFGSLAPHGVDLESARTTGEVTIRRHGDTVQLSTDGTIEGMRLDHRAIAPQPIAITAGIAAQLAISPEAIAVERLALSIGAAHWTASGWLRRGTPVSGQLDLKLASAPCADLVTSIPVEIRGPLDGMVATGMFGGRGHLAIDLAAPLGEGVELDTSLDNRCEVTAEPPGADVTALAGITDQTYADGTHARVGPGAPGWSELRRVPSFVSGAFTSAEDARFADHHGFDVHQIARSLEIDLRDRRLARGGSTISQQLVKNAFLTQRRSVDRKIQEAILTWRLEARLDKKTILERYLNVIELGPHIFGIGAAARYWFDSTPRELSIRQAAFLAAMTSEPQSMSRRVRHAGALDSDSAARVDIILRAMRRDGVLDKEELDTAREQQMHFAQAALRRDP